MDKKLKCIFLISGEKQSGKDTMVRKMKERYSFNLREYAFAHKLKAFCIDVLGLTYEQCYGTEEDKNTYTKYRWEDVDPRISQNYLEDIALSPYLTARRVMQVVGTDLLRKLFYDRIWIDSAFNQIEKDQIASDDPKTAIFDQNITPSVAAILDCRFINEIKDTQDFCEKNGYNLITVRIKRPSNKKDQHSSERDLDNYSGFNFVINNDGTLEEYYQKINQLLDELEYE